MDKKTEKDYDSLSKFEKGMMDKTMDIVNDIKRLCEDNRTPHSGVTALAILVPYQKTSDKIHVAGSSASFINKQEEMQVVMDALKMWAMHDSVTLFSFMQMAAEVTKEADIDKLTADIFSSGVMQKS